MTREERLKFCKICKHRNFNNEKGIVCGLTGEVATFTEECPDFEHDEQIENNAFVANTGTILDNSKRASVAIRVFWGICIANFLAVISGYFEYELLERIRLGEYFTDEEAGMNDLRQGFIGITQSGLYIISIITFLNWYRRAYGNLRRMNVGLEYEESMAVWSFFIPIISLYRPYQIAKEIAHETRKKVAEFDKRFIPSGDTSILGIWWALFIITNWVGQFAFKMVLKEDTIEQMIATTLAYLTSDFIDIPAAIVTIMMIQRISNDEKRLFEMTNER